MASTMASGWPRIILHADMDAFYAAIEQRDHPDLAGKPVIVGHPGRRGVVTTASYEARPFGVGSAMPMARARRLCPHAVIVPPRFDRYQEVSAQVMEVFHAFSPLVEPLSLDEAFIDMTGAERLFGTPDAMGRRLKLAVREATGLAVSVGVSTTKYVAKVASDHRKPDGLTIVGPDQVRAFLDPQPVKRLWGVGPKAASRLEGLGLRTIADVAAAKPEWLGAELGALGEHIHALALADDPRPVIPEREAKSVGHEETLEYDIKGAAATRPLLRSAAERVAYRLREQGLVAGGIRVKLKTASFRLMTRQQVLRMASDSARPIYLAALGLLDQFDWHEPLRLVGLAALHLVDAKAPLQQDLFAQEESRRQARLDRTVDTLKARFGPEAISVGGRANRSPRP